MDCLETIPAISADLDGRILTSSTAEATSTKVETVKTRVGLFTNDVELLDSFQGNSVVDVVEPYVIEKSPDGQFSVSQSEHMEVEEMEDEDNQFLSSSVSQSENMEVEEMEDGSNQFLSSNVRLLGRSDQQLEGQTKTNSTKGLKGNKGKQFENVQEIGKDLASHTMLESKILQDGPVLKLKISRCKLSPRQGNNTEVLLSQKRVSPRKNVSELEELPLTKQTQGHSVKQLKPSTCKEKNLRSNNRSLQRKLSLSCPNYDALWTPPAKRSRQSSVDSECDRYRELRDRNNEASRKSRQNRKARECEMKETAAKLERENQSLKIKADEMERLVKKLREALLEAVMKTKKA